MGCCIDYFIGFESPAVLEETLHFLARQAAHIGFTVTNFDLTPRRKTLFIDPHPESETFALHFMQVSDWAKSEEPVFCGDEITKADWSKWQEGRCAFLHKSLWYCASFTKTEYAPKACTRNCASCCG